MKYRPLLFNSDKLVIRQLLQPTKVWLPLRPLRGCYVVKNRIPPCSSNHTAIKLFSINSVKAFSELITDILDTFNYKTKKDHCILPILPSVKEYYIYISALFH